ncbi:798_t:CDS:2 [Acaulospora colombiana]|uniref:798_t:CDS:1 n=1 Tax=Acaulospora colombiana TaxID=27376 RepID=A0ACA9K7W8_9GLOM|nr:798_t:CDS:2 [Acaulospora colombiana]
MSFHLLVKLSRDICNLFDTAAYYDVIIRVGKGSNAKEFQAHSLILRARSAYFRSNLKGDNVYDKVIIDKSNITPAVFEVILKYIYSGKVDFMNCGGQQTLDLLYAAKELGLVEILESIQDHLIHQQSKWMDANFITHHRTIFSHDYFKTLQVHYIDKIAYNPTCVFDNPKCFSPEILKSLDDLGCIKLNESVWSFIVNWTRSQIPRLGNQVAGWQKEDWIEFKEILASCIPWKSVFSLNWNEFNDLLIPCEPFLPLKKFEDALRYHLRKACGSSISISSPISIQFSGTIINICQATLLASWIDQRDDRPYRPAEIPYEFKLVIRGRRDGFFPGDFLPEM